MCENKKGVKRSRVKTADSNRENVSTSESTKVAKKKKKVNRDHVVINHATDYRLCNYSSTDTECRDNTEREIKRKKVYKSMTQRVEQYLMWAKSLSEERWEKLNTQGGLAKEVLHRNKWRYKGLTDWHDVADNRPRGDNKLITNRTYIDPDLTYNISLYVRIDSGNRTILLIKNRNVTATHLIKYFTVAVNIQKYELKQMLERENKMSTKNMTDKPNNPEVTMEGTVINEGTVIDGGNEAYPKVNSITEAERKKINILNLPLNEQIRCLQDSIVRSKEEDHERNSHRALTIATYAAGKYNEIVNKTEISGAQRRTYAGRASVPSMEAGMNSPAQQLKANPASLYPVVIKFDEKCDPDESYRLFKSINYEGIVVSDTRYYKDYKEVVQYFDTIQKAICAIKTIRANIEALGKLDVSIWDVGLKNPQLPRIYLAGIDPPAGFEGWQQECLDEIKGRNEHILNLSKDNNSLKVVRRVGRSLVVQMEWPSIHAALKQGYMTAYNMRCRLELYDDVKQCYNCLQYGHITATCKSGKVRGCLRCSSPNHRKQNCTAVRARCMNCPDDRVNDHPADSAKCPARLRAVEEARRRTMEYPSWIESDFFEKKRLRKPEPYRKTMAQPKTRSLREEQADKIYRTEEISPVQMSMNESTLRNIKRTMDGEDHLNKRKRVDTDAGEVTQNLRDIQLAQGDETHNTNADVVEDELINDEIEELGNDYETMRDETEVVDSRGVDDILRSARAKARDPSASRKQGRGKSNKSRKREDGTSHSYEG